MEKIILGDIEKHLKNNAVINHSQHGFMKGKSCSSNLISVYDKVTCLNDQGKPVDVIFLDFSKAFDTVSHRIFLDKMSSTQLDKHIMPWVPTILIHLPKLKASAFSVILQSRYFLSSIFKWSAFREPMVCHFYSMAVRMDRNLNRFALKLLKIIPLTES
ncbi:rna-directed dna polymerase from mobile element jockey-like [Pitangus sulphuratus]|nr:rna-directed dna polymerase from mobile element jockey-like [Pitangus sulphuratus]